MLELRIALIEDSGSSDLFFIDSSKLGYLGQHDSFRSLLCSGHGCQHARPWMFQQDPLEVFGQISFGEGPGTTQTRSTEPPAGYEVVNRTILTQPEEITFRVAYP